MTRSNKLWFEVAAFAVTVTALVAIVALAVRVSMMWPHSANGLAIATSIVTALSCVFVGIAVYRQRTSRDDPASMSIQDELDSRNSEPRARESSFAEG